MDEATPVDTDKKDKEKKRRKSSVKKIKDTGELQGDEAMSEPASQEGGVELAPPKPAVEEHKSAALEKIEEILNPTLKIPQSEGPYKIPEAVHAGDVNAMRDLDEKKIIELKEVFTLFDADADGYISENDLRSTFIALGKEPSYDTIQQMLDEAMNPLDFDAFVVLMTSKTIELDPEDVLLEAWSKWDRDGNGTIEEDRIYYDLITFGDRFTKREAQDALEEAPLVKPKTLDEPPKIDYQAFCRTLSGLRKVK